MTTVLARVFETVSVFLLLIRKDDEEDVRDAIEVKHKRLYNSCYLLIDTKSRRRQKSC